MLDDLINAIVYRDDSCHVKHQHRNIIYTESQLWTWMKNIHPHYRTSRHNMRHIHYSDKALLLFYSRTTYMYIMHNICITGMGVQA